MQHDAVTELARELIELYNRDLCNPFPYDGCRKLVRQFGQAYEELGPDFATFSADIASHCGGARKLLAWPEERLLKSQEYFQETFFEKHPKYKPLESWITEAHTRDLYTNIVSHEHARTRLLLLLARLLATST